MRTKTWTARAEDGTRVGDVLARLGGDARDVEEGRVFVGRRRARSIEDAVNVGDVVSLSEAAGEKAHERVQILLNRDDIVAVDKPAGIPTIPDHAGAAHSLVALVARELAMPESCLHATSRLDRGVSGVVCFALSAAVAERLTRARAEGTYARRYVAIAARAPSPDRGAWDVPIGRAKDPRHRVANGRDPAPARSLFASIATTPTRTTLLALSPITGRTHQLRVHASHAAAPLVGDRIYGAPPRVTLPTGRIVPFDRIALHAARVSVPSVYGEPIVIDAPVPAELQALWQSLGGDAAAWDTARLCVLE